MKIRILLICSLVVVFSILKARSISEKRENPIVTPAGIVLKSWEHHKKLKNESLFDPAVRSRAGALGFMQIMPFHYTDRGASFGKEHWSQPAIAIAFGDRLLQEGTQRYKGDPYMSLASYNAGPKPTARWKKQLGGTCTRQEYAFWIGYPETRYYVEKVLIDREIYESIIANSGK